MCEPFEKTILVLPALGSFAPWTFRLGPHHRRMNFLVPGGAGFIGSHVCERLLGTGHAVWASGSSRTLEWSDAL